MFENCNILNSNCCRLPWDQHCLLGWIAEGIHNVLAIAAGLFVAMAFLTLFVSFLFFNQAFYQIYCSQFEQIDSMIRSTDALRINKAKKLLAVTISYHISVKRLDICSNSKFFHV